MGDFQLTNSNGHCTLHRALMAVFAALVFLSLLVLWYYIRLVLKVFRCSNKILILFIIMLWVSMWSDIIYGIFQVIKMSPNWYSYGNKWINSSVNWTNFSIFPLTVMVNGFNFVMQILNIQERIKWVEINRMYVWVIMTIIMAVLIPSSIAALIVTCTLPEHSEDVNIFFAKTSSAFNVVVAIFFVIAIAVFIHKFSFLHPHLVKHVKTILIIDMAVISLSWVTRGVITFVRGYNDFVGRMEHASFRDNTPWFALYNFAYYILLTLWPNLVQIMMLRFLIRNKRRGLLEDLKSAETSQISSITNQTERQKMLEHQPDSSGQSTKTKAF